MLDRSSARQAIWTVLDQAVVSLGVFLVNLALARHLVPADYGTFALLYGALLTLQLFVSAPLLYPMSIRLPVSGGAERDRLLAATALIVAATLVPLGLVLAVALMAFGRGDLVLPALAAFALWQAQETMRRGLLAGFRHRDALLGDGLCYAGQVAAVWSLALSGGLTVAATLLVMAAGYAAAAAVQAAQVGLRLRASAGLVQTARDHWAIGAPALAGNLMWALRLHVFPWALAAASGAAAAASFQAALNVANLANPVIIGLANIIPQTAARAQAEAGNAEAWRAARFYILAGAPPTYGYYIIALAVPAFVLATFYGSASPYAALTLPVRLLVVAWGIGYAVDMVCSFLYGINGAHHALVVNAVGTLVAVILAVPMTQAYGLIGACLALIVSNVVRLAASHAVQRRSLAHAGTT